MARPRKIDPLDAVRMRNAGHTIDEICAELGCGRDTVRVALRAHGLTGRYGMVRVARERMVELWESSLTILEIGAQLGCSSSTVLRLARYHQMPSRIAFAEEGFDGIAPEEERASGESLRLSPWVQARINELRLGMPA